MVLETHKVNLNTLIGANGLVTALKAIYAAHPSLRDAAGQPVVPIVGTSIWEQDGTRYLLVVFQKLS